MLQCTVRLVKKVLMFNKHLGREYKWIRYLYPNFCFLSPNLYYYYYYYYSYYYYYYFYRYMHVFFILFFKLIAVFH